MKKKTKRIEPKVGDRVVLRGRGAHGRLMAAKRNKWCRVVWDMATPAPMIVHLDELEIEQEKKPCQ